MKNAIARPRSIGSVQTRAESLAFSRIPGQPPIFIQYLGDPASLRKYYPSAAFPLSTVSAMIPEVLANYTVDRGAVCDVLDETNRSLGAGQKTIKHIDTLRRSETVAVVTGQQTGLFTGPLYTIYKALSAVRAAEKLRDDGIAAVPVFWAAEEDHDLQEVSNAFAVDRDGRLQRIDHHPLTAAADLPVGRVRLGDPISASIDKLFQVLPPSGFSSDLRSMVEESWMAGVTLGDAFARMMTALTREHGLILFRPLDPRFKQLAAPLYVEAVRQSGAIVEALLARNADLASDGFEPQVLIEDAYFPLFWHTDAGSRVALRRSADGFVAAKDGSVRFTLPELVEIAGSEPSRFSPGVMLRPVVQDFLLPTICYFGGSSEIAYFAQNSEVFRVLGRPVTTAVHRQSFTFVPHGNAKTLERYGLKFDDLFDGLDGLLHRIVDGGLNRDGARLFADVEERINTELNRLDRELTDLDPTLADNLALRRRKILYHIGALRTKFRRAEITRDEVVHRRLNSMFNILWPNGGLQERSLNITHFLNKYGPGFIDWVYESIDLDDTAHRIVYL